MKKNITTVLLVSTIIGAYQGGIDLFSFSLVLAIIWVAVLFVEKCINYYQDYRESEDYLDLMFEIHESRNHGATEGTIREIERPILPPLPPVAKKVTKKVAKKAVKKTVSKKG